MNEVDSVPKIQATLGFDICGFLCLYAHLHVYISEREQDKILNDR